MQKHLLKCVGVLMIFLMIILTLASCGMGGGDSLEIEKISAEILDDGSGATRITIKYYDDVEPPLIFDIPMGLQGDIGETGATGNGIKKIEITGTDEANNSQILTVTYTDDTTAQFPVKNGENGEPGTKIVSVTRVDEDVENEDGSVVNQAFLLIKYSDDTESKLLLPKGADGAPGVGIAQVFYNSDDDTGETYVTFMLSDEQGTLLNPITIKPGKQGEAGVGIEGISEEPEYVYDDADNVVAVKYQLYLSDGRSAEVEIPAGLEVSDIGYRDMFAEDGTTVIGKYVYFVKSNGEKTPTEIPVLNGTGVSSVVNAGKDENGDTLVDVILTDGTKQTFTVPNAVSIKEVKAKNVSGKTLLTLIMTDGGEYDVLIDKPRSIEKIEADTTDPNNYKLTIIFSDGTQETVTFAKTNASWHTKPGAPRDDEGNIGDYWFDTSADVIYYKDGENSWVEIVNFNSEKVPVNVKFVLDFESGEYWPGEPDAFPEKNAWVNRGECFATSSATVPIPAKDGFIFKGWYTVINPNPVINSAFTDLTSVPSNIKLFPHWEAVQS